MNPHATSDTNPNELTGVRACTFAGQQKHQDCSGRWFFMPLPQVKIANTLAPYVCVCEHHLRVALEAVAEEESMDLGYSAPPADFRTPKVTEVKPPKRAPRKRVVEEELSL